MTSLGAWAIACGIALGLGLWSIVSLVPRLSRPRLADRVAPYVADFSDGARSLLDRHTVDPLPVIGALFSPSLERAKSAIGRVFGGTESIARRLRQANSPLTVDGYRTQLLAWGAGGAAIGVLGGLAVSRVQAVPVILGIAIVVLGAVLGVVARDYLLQRAAKARVVRMASELPTVLEFLTLSLSAGEGTLDAIRRVSRISGGELAAELGTVVSQVNTGLPFAQSLTALADDLQLPSFTRCVEQITGALERGTPLAEVLRAQAQDVRDDAKRDLLEVAGKKEVAMLVPLVFLILPVTIAFAIFPGILVLQFGL
ncbi:MAG: type II secretion system F family protein [Rhodoglobus sp.]